MLSVRYIIQEHPFFCGMQEYQVQLIAECAALKQFEADSLLFRRGTEADRFYLIGPGSVCLELTTNGYRRVPIQIMGEGEVLGWSWLFPPYRWEFDARALEPTQSVVIEASSLRNMCATDHELGYELMRRFAQVIVQRLHATRMQLLGLHVNPRTTLRMQSNE
jgi:CRP/FNR family transcriptional regulator, cyclic AMP receptor protein